MIGCNNGIVLNGGWLLAPPDGLYVNLGVVGKQETYVAISAPAPIADKWNQLIAKLNAVMPSPPAQFNFLLTGLPGNPNIGCGVNYRLAYPFTPGNYEFFPITTSGNVGAAGAEFKNKYGFMLVIPTTQQGCQSFWTGTVKTS